MSCRWCGPSCRWVISSGQSSNRAPAKRPEAFTVSHAGLRSAGLGCVDVVEGAPVIEVGGLGLGPSAEVRNGHEGAGLAKGAGVSRRHRGIAWPVVVGRRALSWSKDNL